MKTLNGKEVKRCSTLGSKYDNNAISVYLGEGMSGAYYRITADEILKALSKCKFTTRKAKVHTYLEVAE